MHYVYLLHSIHQPDRTYVGFTANLKNRFKAHNAGQSVHTAEHKPWKRVTYLAFDSEQRARDFEKYLKSHSGMAFANKRLWLGSSKSSETEPRVECPEPVEGPTFVYMLLCRNNTLYVGLTYDIARRLQRHKDGSGPKHTRQLKHFRLVFAEGPMDPAKAVKRERQVKGWTRAKKIAIIQSRSTQTTELIQRLKSRKRLEMGRV